jgi:hypothetical protein
MRRAVLVLLAGAAVASVAAAGATSSDTSAPPPPDAPAATFSQASARPPPAPNAPATSAASTLFHWGNFSEANACNSSDSVSFVDKDLSKPGSALVLLAELATDAGAPAMNVSVSRCDRQLPSLRTWGGTPRPALPDVMYASPVSLGGAGVTFVLWFQYACVLLGTASVQYAPYKDCANLSGSEAATYPSVALRFMPNDARSFDEFFALDVAPADLPGTTDFNVSATWLACGAAAQAPVALGGYNMLAASFAADGGVLLALNNATLPPAPGCNNAYPRFSEKARCASPTTRK